MSQKTKKTFKVNVYCDYTNRLVDTKYIQATSKAMAKQKTIVSVEAHLDWYGDETCNDGIYPNHYSVEARELTQAETA